MKIDIAAWALSSLFIFSCGGGTAPTRLNPNHSTVAGDPFPPVDEKLSESVIKNLQGSWSNLDQCQASGTSGALRQNLVITGHFFYRERKIYSDRNCLQVRSSDISSGRVRISQNPKNSQGVLLVLGNDRSELSVTQDTMTLNNQTLNAEQRPEQYPYKKAIYGQCPNIQGLWETTSGAIGNFTRKEIRWSKISDNSCDSFKVVTNSTQEDHFFVDDLWWTNLKTQDRIHSYIKDDVVYRERSSNGKDMITEKYYISSKNACGQITKGPQLVIETGSTCETFMLRSRNSK
jgi:hypothetical protein